MFHEVRAADFGTVRMTPTIILFSSWNSPLICSKAFKQALGSGRAHAYMSKFVGRRFKVAPNHKLFLLEVPPLPQFDRNCDDHSQNKLVLARFDFLNCPLISPSVPACLIPND